MSSRAFHLHTRLRRAVALVMLMPLLAAFTFGVGQSKPAPKAAKQAKRVLVISLDGLDARYLNKRDEYKLKIPALRRLLAEGATATRGVISVYPSVTYPAHITMVTGALPARHGIFGNEMFEPPDGPQTGELTWHARAIKVDTLWDAAARKRLKTGMVSWPVAVGAGDYSFPEIFKVGGTQAETLELIRANARPLGLIQELEGRDPALYGNINADESDDMRTRFAEFIIREKRPDLLLVHLFDLDHFEHDYGPFTPEVFAILEKVDGYVGRILAAAESAGTLSETAVFIVSDHGFMPIRQNVNPGVLLAKAGLIKLREEKDTQGKTRAVVEEWRVAPYPTSGSCSIILRDPNDKEALKKARNLFAPLAGKQGSGILRVIEAKEIRALGGNPGAAFMLEAAEGYTFGRGYTGEFITNTSRRGQHGYLPTRPDYKASLIISGAGLNRRGDLGEVSMIDIAPTIARLLGLSMRNSEGQAIK